MNIDALIEFSGILLSLFSLIFIIVIAYPNHKKHQFFILFIFEFLIIQTILFIEHNDIQLPFRNDNLIVNKVLFGGLTTGFFLLLPTLKLYIHEVSILKVRPKKWLHLVLPLVISVVLTLFTFNRPAFIPRNAIVPSFFILFSAESIFLLISIQRIVRKHLKILRESYSFTEGIDIKWGKTLAYSLFVLFFGIIASEYLIGHIKAVQNLFLVAFVGFICIYFFKYVLVSNRNLIAVSKRDEKIELITEEIKHSDKENEIFQKIDGLLKETELSMNSSLSIKDLASEIGINYKYISQAISEQGLTFYELINTERAKRAKHLLEDKEYQFVSIEDIAFQCGFKSKVTFYKYFKKLFNTTPSEYRNKTLS